MTQVKSLTPAQVKFVQNLQAQGLSDSDVYPYIRKFRQVNNSTEQLSREHFESVVAARTSGLR